VSTGTVSTSLGRAHRSSQKKKGGRKRFTVWGLLRWVLLFGFALYVGLPMLWILLAPSKTRAEFQNDAPYSFGSFANYGLAFKHLLSFNDGVILQWLGNSVLYAVAIVALSLAISIPAGYALARTKMWLRETLLILTLIVMVIPAAARTVPLYLEMVSVSLINTPWALILPSSLFPFGVYLAYIHFSTSLPPSLIEAAKIDGVSEIGAFLRIGLPLARPLMGLITFFAFVGAWSEYFLPLVMLQNDKLYNLPVGLGALLSSSPGINPTQTASQLPIYGPEIAMAGLVLVVPVIIVFIACQRFLAKGLLDGAVKD
jgi:multiple sugar transport system permease protein